MESLYDILLVDQEATLETIKKSYQELILKHHPDKNGDSQKYMQIDQAWKLLRDPEARKKYNAELYQKTVNLRHIIHDTISSRDFIHNVEEDYHFFICKCGGYYILPDEEDSAQEYIICCDECSLVIKVLNYQDLSSLNKS